MKYVDKTTVSLGYHVSNDRNTYPALGVLVRMILLRQSEVSFPDFTLLMSENKNIS